MSNPTTHDPMVVEVTRGPFVESTHLVDAVVVDENGPVHGWGAIERLTMPRSAIKSTQVLPLIASGAAAAFAVTDDEVALGASSHNAEPLHIELVRAWLHRIGLNEDALECGPSDPISIDAARHVWSSGHAPGRVHNCCSGKHSGFLTLARHLDIDHAGYLSPDHPIQHLIRQAQEDVTGVDLSTQIPVIDGCGIPVYQFPLIALAHAMRQIARPETGPEELRDAMTRVNAALPDRSFLVSGTGRAEFVLAGHASEPMILKGGAEGVFMGGLPERGLGVALKAHDGSARAADQALSAILHMLGVIPTPVEVCGGLKNRAGTPVGSIRVNL